MSPGDGAERVLIWLDCDPGHDDAFAIILAGWHQNASLLGISTVAGNQTVEKVTMNALDVLHAAGLPDVGVVAGQSKPLLRPSAILCPEIHGDSGLDGPKGGRLLPRCDGTPLAGKAVDHMYTAIHKAAVHYGCKVRLVCTGALTNAALLLILYPEVVPHVDIVIMGGCMGVGNTGAVVEFNIQTDPEAAKAVFESGVALTMVPLEVTHTALVTPAVLARLSEPSTPFRGAVRQLLLFFASTYERVFRFNDPPLHDPCAVALAIQPSLFQMEAMRVDIETSSALSAGQTVCDVWRQTGRPPNCHVATKMDIDGFWHMLAEAVDRADATSPLNTQGQCA